MQPGSKSPYSAHLVPVEEAAAIVVHSMTGLLTSGPSRWAYGLRLRRAPTRVSRENRVGPVAMKRRRDDLEDSGLLPGRSDAPRAFPSGSRTASVLDQVLRIRKRPTRKHEEIFKQLPSGVSVAVMCVRGDHTVFRMYDKTGVRDLPPMSVEES